MSDEDKGPKGMTNDYWEELDLLAISTIRLHLARNIYLTVLDYYLAKMLWKKYVVPMIKISHGINSIR